METITKTFLASTGLQSWKQKDAFSRVPIRRLAICLNTNEAFLGSKQLNPFHFRKFNLEQICIYRNGLPVADSPMNTADVKRLYFNTMSDLAYIDDGQGISFILFTLNLPIVQFQLNLSFQLRCPVILKFS